MAPAEPDRGATDGDVVEFEPWIYGVVSGVGYTTKAVSHGLDAGLDDPYLRGHYTPIRAAAAQTSEDEVDLHMIHPLRTGRELLLSRLSRGIPVDAGPPTLPNHTRLARPHVLPPRELTLPARRRALLAVPPQAAHPRLRRALSQ